MLSFVEPKCMPFKPCDACTLGDVQGWDEEKLAELVTRDSMVGVCLASAPSKSAL